MTEDRYTIPPLWIFLAFCLPYLFCFSKWANKFFWKRHLQDESLKNELAEIDDVIHTLDEAIDKSEKEKNQKKTKYYQEEKERLLKRKKDLESKLK